MAGYEQKKEAPASITVITAEDLKNKPITSLADARMDVEGVDIRPTAGKKRGLNIHIRGLDAEYTLVLNAFVSGPLVKDFLDSQLRARKAERDPSNVGYLDESDQDVALKMGRKSNQI